jgi:hypoxanthine phosphoribosyltransferase
MKGESLRPDFAERIVIAEDEISSRVVELGQTITKDYVLQKGAAAEVSVVSILKGSFIFLADLIRQIELDLKLDFMAISSYHQHNQDSAGVAIIKDLSQSVYGKNILLVEDIIDTGLTLSYVLRNLESRRPAEIKVCTLLDRISRRIAPVDIDYIGFEVGEEYLVGYGLDYMQKWRNLRYISTLD